MQRFSRKRTKLHFQKKGTQTMSHFRNTTPYAGRNGLVKIVESIIETKIQYAKQQQDFLCKSLDILQQAQGGVTVAQAKLVSEDSESRFHEIMDQMEQMVYSIELLLMIKTFLRGETVNAIYDLMINDKYLFYAPEKLQQLLNLEVFLFGDETSLSEN